LNHKVSRPPLQYSGALNRTPMSAHPVAAGNGNGDAILGVFVPLVN
jgi:hypothetical protein